MTILFSIKRTANGRPVGLKLVPVPVPSMIYVCIMIIIILTLRQIRQPKPVHEYVSASLS